jgi:Domain of unknown function (DUF5071)
MDIKDCIPKDKFDTAAIERARGIGFPALNPIIGDLLEWVQDANWPVAPDAASLLSKADIEILPCIRAVLMSDDAVWKLWTLELVAKGLRSDVLAGLQGDLERIAAEPTPKDQAQGVDAAARSLLIR